LAINSKRFAIKVAQQFGARTAAVEGLLKLHWINKMHHVLFGEKMKKSSLGSHFE
jgi:hypothetical protein